MAPWPQSQVRSRLADHHDSYGGRAPTVTLNVELSLGSPRQSTEVESGFRAVKKKEQITTLCPRLKRQRMLPFTGLEVAQRLTP